MILVTPGLLGYYSTTLKGEWRDVAAYVSQHTEDSDVILVIDDDQGSDTKAFSWYYAGGAQNVRAIDSALTSPGHITDVVERYAQHHQRPWLVVANPGTPVADFLLGSQNQALRLVQSTTFHPGVVALFDVQPALGSIGP